jgi:hypothetical protein
MTIDTKPFHAIPGPIVPPARVLTDEEIDLFALRWHCATAPAGPRARPVIGARLVVARLGRAIGMHRCGDRFRSGRLCKVCRVWS